MGFEEKYEPVRAMLAKETEILMENLDRKVSKSDTTGAIVVARALAAIERWENDVLMGYHRGICWRTTAVFTHGGKFIGHRNLPGRIWRQDGVYRIATVMAENSGQELSQFENSEPSPDEFQDFVGSVDQAWMVCYHDDIKRVAHMVGIVMTPNSETDCAVFSSDDFAPEKVSGESRFFYELSFIDLYWYYVTYGTRGNLPKIDVLGFKAK